MGFPDVLGRLIDPTGLNPLPGTPPPGWFFPGKDPASTWDTAAHDKKEDAERQALEIIKRAEAAAGKPMLSTDLTDTMTAIAGKIMEGSYKPSDLTATVAFIKNSKANPDDPNRPPTQPLPTGFVWVYNPETGYWKAENDPSFSKPSAGPSAAENARDLAAANASNALTGLYGKQAEQIARNLERVGTPVPGMPGFIFDAKGDPMDSRLGQVEIDKQREIGRHNLQVEIDARNRTNDQVQGTRQQGEFQTGQLEESRLGREQTGAYQQGQLGIQRGELANSVGRLALDRQTAESNIRAKQQENSLARNKYVADILGKPSDFMARVITQRGLGNPTPVTQADLINQINTEFAGLQPGQTLNAPQPQNPLGVPQLAMGGMVNDPKMIVGDPQQAGVPNPEMILNPTGAPIGVVPMNRLGGQMPMYAQGTGQPSAQPQVDPETKLLETKVTSLGKLLQFVDNPDTQHELVDELAFYRKKLGKGLPPKEPNLLDDVRGKLSGIPKYAEGTDGPTFRGLNEAQFNALSADDREYVRQGRDMSRLAPPVAPPQTGYTNPGNGYVNPGNTNTTAPSFGPGGSGDDFFPSQAPMGPVGRGQVDVNEVPQGGISAPTASLWKDLPQPQAATKSDNKFKSFVKATIELNKPSSFFDENSDNYIDWESVFGGLPGTKVVGKSKLTTEVADRIVAKSATDLFKMATTGSKIQADRAALALRSSPDIAYQRAAAQLDKFEDFLKDFNPGATTAKVTSSAGRLESDAAKSFDLLKQTVAGAKAGGQKLSKAALDKLDVTPRYAYGTQPTYNATSQSWERDGKPVNLLDSSGQLSEQSVYGTAPAPVSAPAPPVVTPPRPVTTPVVPQRDKQLDDLMAQISRLSQPMTLPTPYIPPAKTQAELETGADAGAKAIGLDSMFGKNFGKRLTTKETTPNPIGANNALRFEFAMFSPQQIQSKTTDELIALDKYLGLKYNTTLQDVLEAQQMVYQAPQQAKRRLVRR